jgi:hypothetical protein
MLLKSATGSDTFGMSETIAAGSSQVEPKTDTQPGVPAADVTLSWKSFTAAADQAGISRKYGGIHFNDGDFEARKAGEDVGLLVWSKAKTYFSGKAVPKTQPTRTRRRSDSCDGMWPLGGVERPRRVVRFARLIQRRVRAFWPGLRPAPPAAPISSRSHRHCR